MMKKISKFLALALTLALALSLAACGGDSGAKDTTPPESQPAGESVAPNEGSDPVVVRVGATPAPHAAVLEVVKELLKEQNIDLQIQEFDDYILPNTAVEDGSLDANYFQHITYMNNFNEENGTHLVNVAEVHYEPFAIYAGKTASLDELADGATIAVPNDTTNEARALLLLQDNGILTLKDGVGLEATVRDIEENPHNLEIQELEAAQVPRVKDEVAFVVLNGNYAMEAGFSVAKDAVAYEQSDSEAAKTYVNVIAVKEGSENNEAIKALVDALKSDAVKEYINNTYDGGVIPFE